MRRGVIGRSTAWSLRVKRRPSRKALLGAAAAASVTIVFGRPLSANTADNVTGTAANTPLDSASSYNGGSGPVPGSGNDVVFSSTGSYSGTFTLNSSALSVGTLNDFSSTPLSISASQSITLNGGSNSVAPERQRFALCRQRRQPFALRNRRPRPRGYHRQPRYRGNGQHRFQHLRQWRPDPDGRRHADALRERKLYRQHYRQRRRFGFHDHSGISRQFWQLCRQRHRRQRRDARIVREPRRE